MKLSDEVLDALADDSESIVQIINTLNYYEIAFEKDVLITTIKELLRDELIIIVYPYDMEHIKDIDVSQIEKYWFELTPKGRERQSQLVIED